MKRIEATELLVCLWARCRFPHGLPDDLPDAELVADCYRWVEENRDRDWRVCWFLRLAECEARAAAAPWN
jgi:hypothetical protein